MQEPSSEPIIQTHAEEQLRFIRNTMERASSFTAMPGRGGIIMGVIGFMAAVVAHRWQTPERWLATWLTAAVIVLSIGLLSIRHKTRVYKVSMWAGAGRRFWISLGMPMVTAALLSMALYNSAQTQLLPGLWLLSYGTAVITGGVFSVRVVPIMGICFMVVGSITLFAPHAWGDALMAVGFGGIQIIFGIIIARRHGG